MSNDYQIIARIIVDVDITISAKDLDEALKKARDMKVTDFVEIKGEYMDGAYKLKGVWVNDEKSAETVEGGSIT